MKPAYYNEIDEYAAQWLRNLIAFGHIAPGEVDTRSIEDVSPDDLRGFAQCHFFAGIGVWSYAARRAGWEDSRELWSGSCPCQPYSQAGEGKGFADERHLWPHFYHLIGERHPSVVVGEQVASSYANPWIDLVCDDMEALDYAVGAVAFPSASVGAPHIRDRMYWLAHADNTGSQRRGILPERANQRATRPSGMVGGLADASSGGRLGRRSSLPSNGRNAARVEPERLCDAGDRPGAVNGYWSAADWIGCTDGKWRPVEPGAFPLAYGIAGRVGRLRAYGNAINAQQARIFIEIAMQCIP